MSSAGKTSIGRALQRGLERVAVFVPADDLDLPRPSKAVDGRARGDLLGLQDRLESLYAAMLVTIASRGFHAIGEVFISSPEQMRRYRDELTSVRYLIVRVTAPLEVVEARERVRGDRHLGTAARQIGLDRVRDGFDLTLDAARLSTEAAAAMVISRVQAIERAAMASSTSWTSTRNAGSQLHTPRARAGGADH